MKKILLIGILLVVSSCKTNPFTGKQTLNFMSNSSLFPTSFSQYNEFLSTSKVIKGTPEAEMIKRVGERIAKASQLWLDRNGYKNYLKGLPLGIQLGREQRAQCVVYARGKNCILYRDTSYS